MPPFQPIDNQKIAQLLIAKKCATREQISAVLPHLATGKDIGALLVERGVLPQSIYLKILEHLNMNSTGGTTAEGRSPHGNIVPPPTASRPAAPPRQQPVPVPPVTNGSTGNTALQSDAENLPVIAKTCTLPEILAKSRAIDASDVHLTVNNPVIVRRYGMLLRVGEAPLDAAAIEDLVRAILSEEQLTQFEKTGDIEFVYTLPDGGRFRMTIMKQRAGWDCTARCIPVAIRSFEATGMPMACKGLTQWAQGLVLVTGPAACGKTSSLATLVDLINSTRPDHVITLESPIEYVYTSQLSQITQREIGKDTASQEVALRAALREDPDVIVVGELRDLSTIQLAVSAAETGHLVFATMNTVSASRTIYRLIDSFPPEEQPIMRNMISESLRGVISQQLIARRDGAGMVAAFEVLLVNSAVANMIRKDEAHQLGTAMITGKSAGMQLLDDSLRALAAQGIIAEEEAALRSMTRSPTATK